MPDAYEGHKRASDSLESGITDGCELPCRCWKLNLHALGKQSVLSSHWAISHSPRVIIWFMVLEIQSETDKIIPLQRQRTRRLSLHQILLQQEWHQCIYKIKPSWCNHLLSILLWLLKWQLTFFMSFQENIKNITQRLFKSLRRLKVTEL